MNQAVNAWMSWEAGLDLVALSAPGLQQPDVIIHVARMVHTPQGSAASGMILLPGEGGNPLFAGFVSTDAEVASYFGPQIFAGTPFENAPVHLAEIDVHLELPFLARLTVKVAGHNVELELRDMGPLVSADRPPQQLPFHDRSLEAAASSATVTLDGKPLHILVPPFGMGGGPAAVFSACGTYSR